jgi:hypothetical protein
LRDVGDVGEGISAGTAHAAPCATGGDGGIIELAVAAGGEARLCAAAPRSTTTGSKSWRWPWVNSSAAIEGKTASERGVGGPEATRASLVNS